MAEHLAATTRRPVASSDPEQVQEAAIIVFLGVHEPPNALPRILRRLSLRGARIILGHDPTARTTELSDLAARFGVWALFDVRGDVRVLTDLVRRGMSSPARPASAPFSTALTRWHVPPAPSEPALTRREREVVQLMFTETALSVEEISDTLGISVHTVNAHLRNIRGKVGARYTGNRDALRDALVDLGWLD